MSDLTAATSAVITARIPIVLKDQIERDAQLLGCSISDAVRWRLKTGFVPSLDNMRKKDAR